MNRRQLLCSAAVWLAPMYMTPEAAFAQAASAPPPRFDTVVSDVDMVSGKFRFSISEGAIGAGESLLTLDRYWGDGVWRNNWSGGLYHQTAGGVTTYYVELGDISDRFQLQGSGFVSVNQDGATLRELGGGVFEYVARDGTVITYQTQSGQGFPIQAYDCPITAVGACSIPVSIVKPNGMAYALNWDIVEKCEDPTSPDCPSGGVGYARFRGVSNTPGYSVSISYLTNDPGNFSAPVSNWYVKTGSTFDNPANSCGTSCPAMTYATTSNQLTLTDRLGRAWRFTLAGQGITGIKRPASATGDTTTVTYSGFEVSNLIIDGVGRSYARATVGNEMTTTLTDAYNNTQIFKADLTLGRIKMVTNEVGKITEYEYYSPSSQLKKTIQPEGNAVEYEYDGRGNVKKTIASPKTGSLAAPIITEANYPASCANPKTCNRPVWTKDAKANVTDYAYDEGTGQVTSVTLPAQPNGIRPQIRYLYTPISGVSLPTRISACQTLATCDNAADEQRTAIVYNTNLLPESVSRGSGDGLLVATAAMTYNAAGDVAAVDGPLPGTDDTTRFRYDVERQLRGIASPDPDGGGAMKPRAVRLDYNADGQVTLTEQGAVSPSYDWNSFLSLQQQATDYDPATAREMQTSLSGGGTTYAVTQQSYDLLGRPDCTATRMNTATFGSLPTACTPATTGTDGPDRITRLGYDAASRVQTITNGYAVSARVEATYSYTDNGRQKSLADANGNVTTWEYDPFDRLSQQRYPNATGGGSSALDYDGFTYDRNGNVERRRLRNNTFINYGYDALNRRTSKALRATPANQNASFGYDNLGRMTGALSASPLYDTSVAMTYDALDRKVREDNGFLGFVTSKTMGYDLAGRRTRLTWLTGGIEAQYVYTPTDLTEIREQTPTTNPFVLATFAHDDLGRRTSLSFGNGAGTGYGYDGVSRLTSLTTNLAGTASDMTQDFTYTPAGQILRQTRSNTAYSYTGYASETAGYTVDGLNRYTSAAGTPVTYDLRGNLASYGGRPTISYSSENRLTLFGADPNRLYYDALGRLIYSKFSGTRFDWDGWELTTVTSIDGAVQRRYVHGPGTDEPLIWYEGADNFDRRWMQADERGSIIAVTDGGGNPVGINAYDEYGVPKPGNVGRFGYTGQLWLGEIGMSYYKNRMYVPTLGRFAQTDPIGYDAGPNIYNYVGGDPVNFIDPLGLQGGPSKDIAVSDIVVTCDLACQFRDIISWERKLRIEMIGSPRGGGGSFSERGERLTTENDIVVTGKRRKQPALNFVGNRPSGGPDDDEDPNDYEEYQQDLDKCRAMKGAAAANCYGAAERRRFARNNGKPLPPLARVAAGAAGGVAIGTILYWMISEGSRIFFPLRNLVPVP